MSFYRYLENFQIFLEIVLLLLLLLTAYVTFFPFYVSELHITI